MMICAKRSVKHPKNGLQVGHQVHGGSEASCGCGRQLSDHEIAGPQLGMRLAWHSSTAKRWLMPNPLASAGLSSLTMTEWWVSFEASGWRGHRARTDHFSGPPHRLQCSLFQLRRPTACFCRWSSQAAQFSPPKALGYISSSPLALFPTPPKRVHTPWLQQGTMAIQVLGLPDDEIDRLLSEAESRLSAKNSSEAGVVAPIVPSAKALKAAASPLPVAAGDPTAAVSEDKAEKLSVRVPQPPKKKKVGTSYPFLTPPPPPFRDEELSHFQ